MRNLFSVHPKYVNKYKGKAAEFGSYSLIHGSTIIPCLCTKQARSTDLGNGHLGTINRIYAKMHIGLEDFVPKDKMRTLEKGK